MNWLYPEEGQTWKEGDEIVAEFDHVEACSYTHRLKRVDGCWLVRKPGENRVFFDSHICIIAYMPYVKPTPPEKLQNCPFCGGEMTIDRFDHYYTERYKIACRQKCIFLIRKTKSEAIKALNSVRVEGVD